jgi:hypothetical protein
MAKDGHGLFNPKPQEKPSLPPIGEHACEVCGSRASFAYDYSELRNVQGRWRCFSHRLENEAKAGA